MSVAITLTKPRHKAHRERPAKVGDARPSSGFTVLFARETLYTHHVRTGFSMAAVSQPK
jgi:hypothetical protein